MPHWTPKMLGWLNREPDFSCILLFILAYIAAILIWLQNTLHDDILWYRWRVRCQVMNAEWGADGRVILRSTLRSSDPQHCKRYFFASIWFMDMSNLPPWSGYISRPVDDQSKSIFNFWSHPGVMCDPFSSLVMFQWFEPTVWPLGNGLGTLWYSSRVCLFPQCYGYFGKQDLPYFSSFCFRFGCLFVLAALGVGRGCVPC